MAPLLLFLRPFISLAPPPLSFISPRISGSSRPRCSCSLSTARGFAASSSSAILWFKQDLRLDDHPGLLQASKYPALLPLYVFDYRILSRYSDEMLELVLFALEDIRKLLKEKGSNLMVRFGSAENVIRDLLEEVNATSIFAEEEVEYHLREIIDIAQNTLDQTPSLYGNPKFVLWRTPFYNIKDLKDFPASYAEFEKLQLQVTSPLLARALPGAEMELEWASREMIIRNESGSLPTLDDLKKFMDVNPSKLKESWTLIKEMSIDTILQKKLSKSTKAGLNNMNFQNSQRKRTDTSVFITQTRNVVGGGTDNAVNALAAYLRFLEGTARDDWQEVHEKLRNAESREGASFLALFGPALCLGIISRRRVHYEALKYEKERNAGFLSPFGYSTATIAAAADAVCSMEWYWLMALKNQVCDGGATSSRIWRWKGHLIQYTVVGHKGPAVLLVHGFGAFLEHYRDNIRCISEDGNRVWALTILGFGKSEKPNVVYTELLWAELVRDFIIEVVGEPVHHVGNSIGGYFVALVTHFWPTLSKSVVLINSAGDVIPGNNYLQFTKERSTSGVAWVGARVLLFYLRLNIKSFLKNCYPTKSERADEELIGEMLRASYDPGVLVVLESIFTFNLSIPLNYLLDGLEEKVLVIQGMKDPISDSKLKVAMIKEHCSGIVIREMDAGHCPHDEQPEEFNSVVREWVVTVENKVLARSFL